MINLLVLLVIGQSFVLDEHRDLIELNHKYDDCGKEQFTQVIIYDVHHQPHAAAWVMRDLTLTKPNQVMWYDKDAKALRKVTSSMYRETWTDFDPERKNKDIISEPDRVKLRSK